MSVRLGILRTLVYYPFYPFWRNFFGELGFAITVSPPMTSASFDRGERRFVGDMCLPVESAFYHVDAIKDDVDAIFVPQANDPRGDVYICPVCAGLPAMLRSAFPDGLKLLSINLTPFRLPRRRDLAELKEFGCRPRDVAKAHNAARRKYEIFVTQSREHPWLEDTLTGKAPATTPIGPHILLLGMPYVLGDPFVNAGLPRMLAARNCRVSTPFMIAPELADREVTIEGYPVYWSFAGMSIGALARILPTKKVDGVVYCSSFACGVDSLITPIVQSACRRCYGLPYLLLVLDEHSELAHLEVRLEAFLDCIECVVSRAGAAP